MKGLADKGEREEKRRNEGQKGLGDMNPLTHITITQDCLCRHGLQVVVVDVEECRRRREGTGPARSQARLARSQLGLRAALRRYRGPNPPEARSGLPFPCY